MLESFNEQFGISIPAGLPPRSLKDIYQLPHKGKGKEEEEEKEEKKKGVDNELNIAELLGVESTKDMDDVLLIEPDKV